MRKHLLSLLLSAAMLSSFVPPAAAAEESAGTWYDEAMAVWAERGVLQGDASGDLNPTAFMTRAELAVMLDRIMLYQTAAENTFADVEEGAWYTDAILKANAAGILRGSGAYARPLDTITRQEAMVLMARAMNLSGDPDAAASFRDADQIAPWARDSVGAMVSSGYVRGDRGAIMPSANITRAEAAVMMDNIFGTVCAQPGIYTEDVDTSVVISTGQVTLQDMTISGDLIVAEGVGAGSVTLDRVNVKGRVLVRGSGSVRLDGTMDTVVVQGSGASVAISGDVTHVNVSAFAENAGIHIAENAQVHSITTAAYNTNLTVSGKVRSVTVDDTASGTTIITQSSARIDSVTTSGTDTTVEGSGTVSKVEATENASGTTVSTSGTRVENNSTEPVNTDTGAINAGETGTTSGGNSSGGGGSQPSPTPSAIAVVKNEAELDAALADGSITGIELGASFNITKEISVARSVTIDGNHFTIGVGSDSWSGENGSKALLCVRAGSVTVKDLTLDSRHLAYGLQGYKAAGLKLENVTALNSRGSGLTINGSSVAATGLTISGSGWGQSIDLSKGSGVDAAAALTLDSASGLADINKITEDGTNEATVTVGNQTWYAEKIYIPAGDKSYFKYIYSADATAESSGRIRVPAGSDAGTNGAYLQAVIDAAPANAEIRLDAGSYQTDSGFWTVGKALTLEGSGGALLHSKLTVTASGVTLKELTMKVAVTAADQTAPITAAGDLNLTGCFISRSTQTAQPYGLLVDVEGKLTAADTVFTAPCDPDTAFSASPSVLEADEVELDGCTIATDGYGLFAQHVTRGVVKNTVFTGIDGRPILGCFNSTVLNGLVFDGFIFEMGYNSIVAAGSFTVKNSTFDFTSTPDGGAGNGINIYAQSGHITLENNTFRLAAGKTGINLTSAAWAAGGHDAAMVSITGNRFEGSGACAIKVSDTWTNVSDADAYAGSNALNGNTVILPAA